MRIPLTKLGLPQVLVFPALTLMLAVAVVAPGSNFLPWPAIITVEVILLAVLIWSLCFFRDPRRSVPQDTDILIAPADGRVTDIEIIEDARFGGKTIRIGIFLSVFNVHINRVPCSAKIEDIEYKKGLYKNAMSPQSGRVNESNDVLMTRIDPPYDKLLVRQISGAIARRIVCCAEVGQEFAGGQKFGMIKFGSRTELYLPARENARTLIKIGDKVKAGETILVRYEKCQQ